MKLDKVIWIFIPVLVITGIVALLLLNHPAVIKQDNPVITEKPKVPVINKVSKNNKSAVPAPAPIPVQPAEKIVFGEVSYFVDDCSGRASGETEWKPITEGQSLYESDSIKTGNKSEMEITLGNGDVVKIFSGTEIALKHLENENTTVKPSGIILSIGKIFFKGTPDKSNFQVETQSAVAAVRGTQFTAKYADSQTSVVVFEGKVAVSAQDKTILVLKNQATKVELGKTPEDPFDLPLPPDDITVNIKVQ